MNQTLEDFQVENDKEESREDISIHQIIEDGDFSFWKKINEQVVLMAEYAFSNGIKLSDNLKECLINKETNREVLLKAHEELSEVIAPTTPDTLVYNAHIKNSTNRMGLGLISPYPVIRELFIVIVLAGGIFIFCGLSPEVNDQNLSNGLLKSSGIPLLYVSFFLGATSCLVACFSLLTLALNKVKSVSMHPGDGVYFRATLILGILSGVILSELSLISDEPISSALSLNRMMFAMLGGFSSELVYTTLQSIMNKLKQLVTV